MFFTIIQLPLTILMTIIIIAINLGLAYLAIWILYKMIKRVIKKDKEAEEKKKNKKK